MQQNTKIILHMSIVHVGGRKLAIKTMAFVAIYLTIGVISDYYLKNLVTN
ncbi:MAG: hypothetical protein M3250_02975 [Thermoproteota archaeon]|nr:hypothetical protein [Thermoproteota archaeon]